MARTDNDTWDLASSVGATATMVAAARAVASRGPDPVIDDPFAEPLVRAVGVDFFTRLATGELTPADLDPEETGGVGNMDRFTDGMAARTRFFDDFFTAAAEAGIRQAVILASGLDARAYRMTWPADMVVYEIDQPEVIEFKTTTLAGLGAEPTAQRRTVPIDLRQDWPAALREAGLDPDKPTAWIAEGLFGYLPPEAQDKLLDDVDALSAPGSRLAAEGVLHSDDYDEDTVRERMQAVTDHWRAHGFDLDFSQLVYIGERAEVTEYLARHGWRADATSGTDLMRRYGLGTPQAGAVDGAVEDAEEDEDGQANFANVAYVTATK
ncbi:class I SAM-dependent methyltransferase [Mycolicibacterium palauense]|uniref:class I SAM-dependent methyltransferase n=1 Tax=Mycolicibacterium palauense TaxID=2034511 RepID=UPI000BFEC851|nr:class I SAM-dependent methyltransferase [Mycolicibacterium palauense]